MISHLVTLEYLISVQHLFKVLRGKISFRKVCKEGQNDVFKLTAFGFNLNVQRVNGMTPLDFAMAKEDNLRILDTLKYGSCLPWQTKAEAVPIHQPLQTGAKRLLTC